jgi:hypothetical protein
MSAEPGFLLMAGRLPGGSGRPPLSRGNPWFPTSPLLAGVVVARAFLGAGGWRPGARVSFRCEPSAGMNPAPAADRPVDPGDRWLSLGRSQDDYALVTLLAVIVAQGFLELLFQLACC